MFAIAFLLLGLSRFDLALMHDQPEGEAYLYWLRLAAYVMILIAIIDKNRYKTPRVPPPRPKLH
jgi:Family of unknown function (DUF5985)